MIRPELSPDQALTKWFPRTPSFRDRQKEAIDRISQRARDGGAEIVSLLKTSAWYAPGAAIVEMVDAIIHDRKKILPCAAYLEGEYGINGLFVGVPCKLGARGLELREAKRNWHRGTIPNARFRLGAPR